jgi:PH (Pleckstrin Homology) domain-containing protein
VLSQQQSREHPDSKPEVFRSAGSLILSWAWFVVAVVILVDLAVQGRDRVAVAAGAAVLVITGVVYACAYRPKIVADSAGISLMNPVRDHRVPWAAVVKVDVVNAVRVHCTPAPGAARGKVIYSWAVQSSPRAARKAAMRRDAASRPRGRLTPRPLQPPPGTPPPGSVPRYGEMPDSAKEALDRSPAEFTAARLSERAQHARQAAARAAAGRLPADQDAGQPGEPGADQAVAVAADAPAAGDSPAAAAAEQPTAQWAWLPIAVMTVPLLLLLVALV